LRTMKKQMSGFDLHFLCRELQVLVGGFFSKAYQLAKDEVLLAFNVPASQPTGTDGGKYNRMELFIKVGRFICLERYMGSKPMSPTAFAMMLRKNLANGKVTKVRQVGFDRIIEITIEKQQDYRIIVEMFGDGNMVVLHENLIIQALKAKRWKDREVKAKREFVLPPSVNDPLSMTQDEFSDILRGSERGLVQTLATDVNLGGPYAEEVCRMSGVDKGIRSQDLEDDMSAKLWNALEKIRELATNPPENLVVLKEDAPIDVIPFKLGIYEGLTFEGYENFSKALVAFFAFTMTLPEVHVERGDIDDQISRFERQLSSQEEAISRFKEDIKKNRACADAIYAHFQDCERDLDAIRSAQEELGWEEVSKRIEGSEYPVSVDPSKGELSITFSDLTPEPLTVVLDIRKSASENAGIYYDKTKKAKEKMKGAKSALQKSKERIEALKSKRSEQEQMATEPLPTFSEATLGGDKRKEKEFWFERFRWLITPSGNLVCGGKDVKSNERLVKRHLKTQDRYVHADIHGAPSIVVKASGPMDEPVEMTEETLSQACNFAVIYSRAWNAGIGWSSAYWVMPEQVSRTAPAGEFVPKGAFMIRGKRNHYHKLPLRVAIGLIDIDGVSKVMGGPLDSIMARTDSFVVLVPGVSKLSDIAKEVGSQLDVALDDVQKVLPPGNCSIERTQGFEK